MAGLPLNTNTEKAACLKMKSVVVLSHRHTKVPQKGKTQIYTLLVFGIECNFVLLFSVQLHDCTILCTHSVLSQKNIFLGPYLVAVLLLCVVRLAFMLDVR